MANTKHKKKRAYWVPILFLIITGVVYFIIKGSNKPTTLINQKVGTVDYCRKNPAFIPKVGLVEPVFIDFRQQGISGFQIMEARQDGKVVRMPTWDDAGHLGPYTVDDKGNIYTAPVPYVSIYENPPAEQNKIFLVNTNTGVMKEFLTFDDGFIPDNVNPFGVMGLAFDCETNSLYASSIAGSTRKKQNGIIYSVNPKTKEVMSKVEGFDAIGLGIFNTKSGKKMFLGAARSPEIFSIYLDDKGNFIGQPKFEFSLAAQVGGSYDNAHRIRFLKKNEMEIKAIEFSYSLIASSDPLRNIYKFSYQMETDTWALISVEKQQ